MTDYQNHLLELRSGVLLASSEITKLFMELLQLFAEEKTLFSVFGFCFLFFFFKEVHFAQNTLGKFLYW